MFGRRIALLLVAVASLGCATTSEVGRTAEGAPIIRIPLRLSNVYLVKAPRPVLIDSGTFGDLEELDAALEENGVRTTHLGLVVVTHAHADHAGLAAELRRVSGATVFLGAGDLEHARVGTNDDLRPTSFTATLFKPFIPSNFPEFVPDVAVVKPIDLAAWGIRGQVMQMPGHTPGSLVVVLANHSAFVGDEMAGGSFGGAISPRSPGEHYYQGDPVANRQNIHKLLAMGIETFYLGHGGPVSRADVIAAFGQD